MITKLAVEKSCGLLVATLFIFVLFSGVSVYAADKPIVLSKYPNIKLGFTSQNFSKWLPPTARQSQNNY